MVTSTVSTINNLCTVVQQPTHQIRKALHMKQRRSNQKPLLLPRTRVALRYPPARAQARHDHRRHRRIHNGHQAPLRAHHRLRQRRRARREQHHAVVLRRALRHPPVRVDMRVRPGEHVRPGDHARPAPAPLVRARDDDTCGRGGGEALDGGEERREAVRALGVDDDGLAPCPDKAVLERGVREPRVDARRDGAEERAGPEEDDELGEVAHRDGD